MTKNEKELKNTVIIVGSALLSMAIVIAIAAFVGAL